MAAVGYLTPSTEDSLARLTTALELPKEGVEADQPGGGHRGLEAVRWSGVAGTAVPREYGGLGGDAVSCNRAVEEVARFDASTAIILFQHLAVTARITDWGTEEQKAAVLPRLASGEWIAASAWSETNAGADKRNLSTTARRSGGRGWVLDGAKAFTTGAGLADVYLVLAQTSEPAHSTSTYGAAGQSFFLVEGTNRGLFADTSLDLVGMRSSATGFVELHDCEVDDGALLGPLDEAARVIASVRESGATLGAVSVGIARRAVAMAHDHARRRGQMDHQVVRHRLVDLRTQIEAADALVLLAGSRQNEDPGVTTLHSKLYASSMCEAVVAECQRLLGSAGFVRSHPMNQLASDARAVALMGPVNDLCRELISAGWAR